MNAERRVLHSVAAGLRRMCVVAGALSAGAAAAADFTWLSSPASANWNEADANWSGAGSVWVSAPTNNATFNDSATKSVTADSLTLSNLTFGADGYTVGGGRLTMYGGFSVGSGLSAAFSATVTNKFGICEKKGAGTLVLDSGSSGTNLFSTLRVSGGLVQVTGGTHEVYTNDMNTIYIGFDIRGGAMVVSGGKVRTTGPGYSDMMGSLLITNGIVDLTSSREFLNAFNGPGVTTVAGNGIFDVTSIRVSQYNTGAASQNVVNVNTGGVVRLNNFGIDPGASPKGMVNFNGGTVVAKTSTADFLGTWTNQWLTGISARILEGGAVIDTQGNAISIKQPLVSGAASDGGLIKKGSGALALLSTNSYNGPTVVYGGTVNVMRDQSLGNAPAAPATNLIFMASGTLQSGSNNWLSASRAIWVTNSVTATFDTQGYTQTVYGAFGYGDTTSSVVKVGSGTLVLDPGAAGVNRFGTLQTAVGTLVVASGTNLVTRSNSGQNAPGLRVSGGTMLVAGGVVKTTSLMFVNVDGGHLLVTNGLVDTTSCYELLNSIGNTNNGYTTVSGSGVILANAVRISQSSGNPSNSVVSVNTGGVLRLNNFYIDTNAFQKGILYLNGGTVEARSDNTNFLGTTDMLVNDHRNRWLTNIFVNVREGGAIFNTAGKNITIRNPLWSGAPADGGLIKRGAGTLKLTNTNTFNGATSIEGGTLLWGRDDMLPAGNTVLVSSNAVADLNAKTQTLARLGGSGTVTNLAALSVTNSLAPGDAGSFGTLTLAAAPAALSGTLSVNVSTNGACDRLHVNGDLNLNALSLTIEDTAQLSKFKRYTVASCTGSFGIPFGGIGALPERWLVRYDAAGKQVYLVYDFGTLIMVR